MARAIDSVELQTGAIHPNPAATDITIRPNSLWLDRAAEVKTAVLGVVCNRVIKKK
jgi:hypothetical protein